MDFTAAKNAASYSSRSADSSWADQITGTLDPRGLDVVDIGCGGGIYSRAWRELGAASVTGVDSSRPILAQAAADHEKDSQLTFRSGEALATGLETASADVVFARALVHHLDDLRGFVGEAVRLLRPGGRLLIQDRTLDDVAQPADAGHVRGFFFAAFPHLLEVEARRRPAAQIMTEALEGSGCVVDVASFWEVRAHHPDRASLLADVAARTGRSILHELDDAQLASLVATMEDLLPAGEIVETDRWTLWSARPTSRSETIDTVTAGS